MFEDCHYSLVFINRDNHKQVNEKQGHEAGEHYVIKVIEAIRKQFRTTDVIFHMGEDEFDAFLKEYRESITPAYLNRPEKIIHPVVLIIGLFMSIKRIYAVSEKSLRKVVKSFFVTIRRDHNDWQCEIV